MYYDFQEPSTKIAHHRVLAVNRGEKEKVLRVTIEPPVENVISYLQKEIIMNQDIEEANIIQAAIDDGYKRLLEPSIERDIRSSLTETAEEHCIDIFAKNLKNLLLQPPLKGKVMLGVDPAFRTGCKLAVIDETGAKQEVDVIYPTEPRKDVKGSEKKVLSILERYPVELIAIGNGTAQEKQSNSSRI